jgi:hypothetical protein
MKRPKRAPTLCPLVTVPYDGIQAPPRRVYWRKDGVLDASNVRRLPHVLFIAGFHRDGIPPIPDDLRVTMTGIQFRPLLVHPEPEVREYAMMQLMPRLEVRPGRVSRIAA